MISNGNKDETQHTTKDNKDNVENPDEQQIESKEVNTIESKYENSESLEQITDDNNDYTSSYESSSSENHDDYNSEYEETSNEDYVDYSSDYLETSDHYTYDDMENIEENYDDYISEKSNERNWDDQIDAVGDATVMNWTEESQDAEDKGTFMQLTNDYADSSDENADNKGHFVQLTNDYAESSYDSDSFESADAIKTERKDSHFLDDFKVEAVDEPVFLQSEFENSNMALKSSMNIENAAQVSEMVFPVSSGRQLTVEFFSLLLLICLLNVTFYFTNFRLII